MLCVDMTSKVSWAQLLIRSELRALKFQADDSLCSFKDPTCPALHLFKHHAREHVETASNVQDLPCVTATGKCIHGIGIIKLPRFSGYVVEYINELLLMFLALVCKHAEELSKRLQMC